MERSENNIKDITEIYIASWLVHLKCGTLSKTTKIRFSVKVDFSYVFSKPSKSFNVKTSSKQLLDRGKDSLLLPYTYTPSSSTLGLLLHVQFYQRCEPMISKMWKKNESVLWQPHYYNLLTEKKKKSRFWSTHFFWKRAVAVSLKKLSSNAIFRWYTFRKFYIVKLIYFSERPNTVKERFWNTFDWKMSLVSTKLILHQCHSSYTRRVSSHRFTQFLGFYNICIIYLHEIEAHLSYYCHVLFLPFEKSFKNFEKYF